MQLSVTNNAFAGGSSAKKLADNLAQDAGITKEGSSSFQQLLARATPPTT